MTFMPFQENSAMAVPTPDTRRRPHRLPFLRFITYGLGVSGVPDSNGKKNQAAAINVSEGGLCLLVNERIHETDILRVDLPLADVSTTSSTLAEVKWSRAMPWSNNDTPQYFVGVQFLL
jgi:hypothetical protein